MISKEVFCLQVLVKCSTMFKTEMCKIRKKASHVLTVKTCRERTKPKDVMRLTRLGKFGENNTLKVVVSSESKRNIEVKL